MKVNINNLFVRSVKLNRYIQIVENTYKNRLFELDKIEYAVL